MKAVWSVARIIDIKSLLVSGLAVASTWLCQRFGLTADFPLTLIATAIVFPLVFSIGTAYRRREKALEDYGNIKAHGRALYMAGRDWLPEGGEGRTEAMRAILLELLRSCRDLFTGKIEDLPERQRRVYRTFSELSHFVERMRAAGLSANECSRCNQYISKIMVSFESIKNIYRYRTPRTLRAFSDLFILLLPVLYGPYFAFQAAEYSPALGYVTPVLFALILVGLANIQNHLENPFDQIGDDDVAINAENFVATLEA